MQEDKLNNINTIYKNEYVILQAVPYASYQQILQPSYAEYTHFLLAKDGAHAIHLLSSAYQKHIIMSQVHLLLGDSPFLRIQYIYQIQPKGIPIFQLIDEH